MNKFYGFDPVTFEYTGPCFGQSSPREPDVYLPPALSTEKEPLPPKEGKTVNFIDGDWVYLDFVAPVFYGSSDADQREIKKLAISDWRNAQEWTSIVFQCNGHDWDGGLQVKARLDTVASLPTLPADYYWTDAQNNDVPMNLAKIQALRAAHDIAIAGRGWEIHQRQRQMKKEIAGLNGDQLKNYRPSWPE